MIAMSSHSTVKNLTLDGLRPKPKDSGTSEPFQNGITAKGNYGDQVDADYLKDLTIQDVTIQNMTGSGITLDLVKGIHITGTQAVTDKTAPMQVTNMGNDGIIGYSVQDMTVEKTLTQVVGHWKRQGVADTNYNIAASMRKMKVPEPDLAFYTRYPNSQNVTIQANVALDNPFWEALDGHSVQKITIQNNVVVGVDRPIVVGGGGLFWK